MEQLPATKTIALFKLNAWYAFACGVFCLILAPQVVTNALVGLGVPPRRIAADEAFLTAVSLVRVCGVLFFGYAFLMRIVLKGQFGLERLRLVFTVFAVGLLVWGGAFLFLLSLRSPILASVTGLGLLESVLIPVAVLFEYKKQSEWKSVRPEDQ